MSAGPEQAPPVVQGLLTDVNVQGLVPKINGLLARLDLTELLDVAGLRLVTFRELGLAPRLDDRSLWDFCQAQGWVLLTDDKNDDGPDSLRAVLDDSWQVGHLPVLTFANKPRFERRWGGDAERVAQSIATLLFEIKVEGRHRDQPRIFLPLPRPAGP